MNPDRKNILIAGGSGLIGKRLTTLLENENYKVFHLTTRAVSGSQKTYSWNPGKNQIDSTGIENADVIINLAGTNIAGLRWTAHQKRMIVNSRIFSTNLLFNTLSNTRHHVNLFINASGIGIYGNTGIKIADENYPPANDFLGTTCQRWEQAAMQFEKSGIRTVIFRIGQVLSTGGGMLPELLKPLKFGIAPVFGSGKQYQSWIHIDDVCSMIIKSIEDVRMRGTYNAVAPGPLSNRNFMKLLVQVTGQQCWTIRVWGIFFRLILGEMAVLLLNGTRVSSRKITETGFIFTYPQANHALQHLLSK